MIFEALQWTVNQLIEQYECPECESNIEAKDINIIWAAWETINMEVCCPECESREYVEAKVFTLDLSQIVKNYINSEWLKDKIKNIENYKNEISDVSSLLENKEEQKNTQIKDEQIVEMNKILKTKRFSVNDLF